ncbi:MAG: hypothetical protein LBO69_04710 [Ignavibacteria bacterium]|jgi:hypothetical protein|nr:hypothetical protein [Ignavibacteria bacterium]
MRTITTKISIALVAIFALLTITSCDSDNNSVNNPVQYSNTYFYTIYKNEWSFVENGHWYRRLNIPAITRNVIDYGVVLVYLKDEATNNWVLLPYSTTLYNAMNQIFTEEIWAGYALGTLDIDYVYTNSLDMTPRNFMEIKVVVMRL